MKLLGLLSDIHGDLEALLRTLDAIYRDSESCVCLGDLVEGGPDSEGCIRLIREEVASGRMQAIRGNHDEEYVRFKKTLPPEDQAFLAGLPRFLERDGAYFVHDNPLPRAQRGEGMWFRGGCIDRLHHAQVVFQESPYRIICVGHTHRPAVYTPTAEFDPPPALTHLDPNERYILNPGAVGQFKSYYPPAGFAFLDVEERAFAVRRA